MYTGNYFARHLQKMQFIKNAKQEHIRSRWGYRGCYTVGSLIAQRRPV